MRQFSEYRQKDYRMPRSMKEAYGWEPPLYVEESGVDWISVVGWIIGTSTVAAIVVAWIIK